MTCLNYIFFFNSTFYSANFQSRNKGQKHNTDSSVVALNVTSAPPCIQSCTFFLVATWENRNVVCNKNSLAFWRTQLLTQVKAACIFIQTTFVILLQCQMMKCLILWCNKGNKKSPLTAPDRRKGWEKKKQ